MSSVPCNVCGCVDFTRQSGYYICNNCDTQSQDIQEQSFEFFTDGPQLDVEEKEEIISHKKEEGSKLTSFECYNLILKGLVEELIELGANSSLKVVAFQLWASYLKRGQIAFFSKTKRKIPALPIGFKNSDAEALYGVPNLRKTFFRDIFSWRRHRKMKKPKIEEDENDTDSSASSKSSLRHKQRKLAVSKLSDSESLDASSNSNAKSVFLSSEGEISGSETTLHSIDEGLKRRSKERKKVLFRGKARKFLNEIASRIEQMKSSRPDGEIPTHQKISLKNEVLNKKRNLKDKSIPMNMCVLVSVLRVALLLTEDIIQLSDLLRWWCEGHLSLSKPERFVPINLLTTPALECILSTRAGFQLDIRKFVSVLELKDIPTPNLHRLIERYCSDFCLPNDFTKFIHGLVAVFTPHMDHASYANRVFPDYECRAMAYILCAFKLLFSLDDVTEIRQSEFAETVNKRNEERRIEDVPVLFSWTSWVKYIECRKALLCEFDVALNQLNQEQCPVNENVALKYWNRVKSERSNPKIGQKINSVLHTQIENAVRQLQRDFMKTEKIDIDFPPSLTPYKSYTELLLTKYPDLVPETSYRILSKKLSDYSVKHILNQEWAGSIARRLEMEIEQIDGLADTVETVSYELPVSDLPTISKSATIPACVDVSVTIDDDRYKYVDVGRPKLPKCKKCEPEYTLFNPASSVKREVHSTPLRIFSPSSQYWFFHEGGRRMSYEQFNALGEEVLSSSFLWLLRECASVLRVDRKDLYLELILVESVLCCLYDDDSYAQETPIALYPNEW